MNQDQRTDKTQPIANEATEHQDHTGVLHKILPFITPLIALTALIIALFLWNKTSLNTHILADQIDGIQSEMNNSQQSVHSVTNDLKEKVTQQQTLIENLQKDVVQLNQATQAQKTPILLEESAYKIRLATLNLQYNRNVPGAISLLESVDQAIKDANDAQLASLRQDLAQNILALKNMPNVDLNGMLARLNAVSVQIPNLPVLTVKPINPTTTTNVTQPKTSKLDTVREKLRDSWHTFQKFIVIRYQNKPVMPLISPEDQTIMIQNIQLTLAQAQWALLHHDKALYQFSLTNAINWVSHAFITTDSSTQNILAELKALQAIDIDPTPPDLSKTLLKFEALLANAQTTPKENPTQPTPTENTNPTEEKAP